MFRNNASYARFTEARLLWGNVLIASRTLTSQILCYAPEQAGVADKLIAFSYALKHQLRRTDPNPDLLRLLDPEETARLRHKLFRPVAILNDIRGSLAVSSGPSSRSKSELGSVRRS